MGILTGKSLDQKEYDEVNILWNSLYPFQLQNRLELFLKEADEQIHFLIKSDDGKIIAWSVLILSKNNWRFSLLVDEAEQGKGLGSLLMHEMKRSGRSFTGWVIDHDNDRKKDGSIYRSPLAFYIKNDLIADNSKRLETPLISAIEVQWQG